MKIYWLITVISIIVTGLIFFFSIKAIFNKYKKLKLIETPNFNSEKYQGQMPGNYYIKPVYIEEEDTNPKLIALKSKYNKLIKFWWYFMGIIIVLVLIGIGLNTLLNN